MGHKTHRNAFCFVFCQTVTSLAQPSVASCPENDKPYYELAKERLELSEFYVLYIFDTKIQ